MCFVCRFESNQTDSICPFKLDFASTYLPKRDCKSVDEKTKNRKTENVDEKTQGSEI